MQDGGVDVQEGWLLLSTYTRVACEGEEAALCTRSRIEESRAVHKGPTGRIRTPLVYMEDELENYTVKNLYCRGGHDCAHDNFT